MGTVATELTHPPMLTSSGSRRPRLRSSLATTTALPGLALAASGALGALAVSRMTSVVSPLLAAVVMGALAASVLGSRPALDIGMSLASRRVLRVGIALLGLQLSVSQLIGLGWWVPVCVAVVVGGGIAVTWRVGALLGVPRPRRLLIACGFSICGAAAVAAVDGVSESDEQDVTAAFALVVAFGTVAMLVIPSLAEVVGFSDRDAGAWIGGSIHEVGQVVVAGGLVGGSALQIAVVVKLARVLTLAPVLTILCWQQRRRAGRRSHRLRPVPAFVVAFVGFAAVASLAPLPHGVVVIAGWIQSVALATAMFALGFALDIGALSRLSSSDFLLGLASSLAVAVLALGLVVAVG